MLRKLPKMPLTSLLEDRWRKVTREVGGAPDLPSDIISCIFGFCGKIREVVKGLAHPPEPH